MLLKPQFTHENKLSRLGFCLKKIKHDSLNTNSEFEEMFDVIRIDEKWLFKPKKQRSTTCYRMKVIL